MRCPKCAEPWDMDCLHDEVEERYPTELEELERRYPIRSSSEDSRSYYAAYEPLFDAVRADFYARGCVALESYGARCAPAPASDVLLADELEVIGMVYELLGDDVDGAEAMLEDAGLS